MREKDEQKTVKLNILITLLCRIVTVVCGIFVPKMLLNAFGSEAYGATTSITQFLSYITLIEGGIGGVARAALYKPLAENDSRAISLILKEIRVFFSLLGYIFAGYVLLLAFGFKSISGIVSLDWMSTFWLVVIISLSTFAQYFIGISYSTLLYASQKSYVINATSLVAILLNAILVFFGIRLQFNLISVKLLSSLVYVMKPIAMWLYVKKNYTLVKVKERKPDVLKQKRTGLGQHIAFFFHNNTDIAILTFFKDLKSVAVYSVYNMVVGQIQNIVSSFSSGMEALFGKLLACKDKKQLHKWFDYYETLISLITVIVYTTMAVVILSFVKIYTANLHDADYRQPLFSLLLILASALYCLRLPYHAMIIAAGHFKQTRLAAYGEAIINVGLSLLLFSHFRLAGIAFATMFATGFRFLYYVIYLSKKICYRPIRLAAKRFCLNGLTFSIPLVAGFFALNKISIDNYLMWAIVSFCVVLFSALITAGANFLFYRENFCALLKSIRPKR